jgi:hypothetical protein
MDGSDRSGGLGTAGLSGADLARVATVGGFFALRTAPPTGPGPDPDSGPGAHTPLARVYEGEVTPLTDRVDRVAARLRAPERRIGASIAHLGLAARLWSIALGCAVLAGAVPDLDPGRLRWNPALTTPDDLWLDGVRVLPATARSVREAVQYGHLVPLAAALRGPAGIRIAPRLLWGNAGSALAGAVSELVTWGRANGRPDVAERARALGAELFDHPDLRGSGETRAAGPGRPPGDAPAAEDTGPGTGSGPGPGPTVFRRRSCCLYYRCPQGTLCGDCVFDQPPRRSSPGADSG